MFYHLENPITFKEVDRAIKKLKSGKASGLNGIPPEAFKAMNRECRERVHKYISDFYEGKCDYEGWHLSQCVPVPKSGDLSNPNKLRGVMLMDVCSKLLSTIMNERAFELFSKLVVPLSNLVELQN